MTQQLRSIFEKQAIAERAPDELEQDKAKAYCLYRPLHRPKTNIKSVLVWLLCFEGGIVVVSLGLSFTLNYIGGTFSFFSNNVFLSIYNIVGIFFLICFSKRILILLIELYQHYASEDIRRKCLLMPTCSEYALLALQKYGVLKGVYKTIIRLTKKCKGDTYYIDYP